MATGRKTVVVGQVIDPDVWGNPVWDQSVQQFASDADRTAQFPVAQRRPGAVTWLDDSKVLQKWDGAGWVTITDAASGLYQPWTFGTSTWLSGGVGVTVGTGGECGYKWRRVGKTVDLRLLVYVGTGFNGGSGAWTWSIPSAAGTPLSHWPAVGYLRAPGGPLSLATVAGWIQSGGTVIGEAVVGQGNSLIGGFNLPAGSVLMFAAKYEVS